MSTDHHGLRQWFRQVVHRARRIGAGPNEQAPEYHKDLAHKGESVGPADADSWVKSYDEARPKH